MGDHSEVFVALDVAKVKNAVAIAEGGRRGEVRYLGEIENSPAATRKLLAKLAKTCKRMTFCYEAGPTEYDLFRWITDLGHEYIGVAPSLIPSKPGDRCLAIVVARRLRSDDVLHCLTELMSRQGPPDIFGPTLVRSSSPSVYVLGSDGSV